MGEGKHPMILWKKLCHKSWYIQIKPSTLMDANFQLRHPNLSGRSSFLNIKGPGWTAVEECYAFVVGTKRIFFVDYLFVG